MWSSSSVLARQIPDKAIASLLNRAGKTTARQRLDRSRVCLLRNHRKIPSYREGARAERGEITLAQAAAQLKVSEDTVRRLISEHILPAHQLGKGVPWVIRAARTCSAPPTPAVCVTRRLAIHAKMSRFYKVIARGALSSGTGGLRIVNSPVDFLADCVQLPLLELGDPDRAPAFDGANERGADERQVGALAKAWGMNAPARQGVGAAHARVLEGIRLTPGHGRAEHLAAVFAEPHVGSLRRIRGSSSVVLPAPATPVCIVRPPPRASA
jgi:excisionase family DNA binding protein